MHSDSLRCMQTGESEEGWVGRVLGARAWQLSCEFITFSGGPTHLDFWEASNDDRHRRESTSSFVVQSDVPSCGYPRRRLPLARESFKHQFDNETAVIMLENSSSRTWIRLKDLAHVNFSNLCTVLTQTWGWERQVPKTRIEKTFASRHLVC